MPCIKDLLIEHAKSCSRLELRLLVAHAVGKTKEFVYAYDDYVLTDEQLQTFKRILKEFQDGKPLPYIRGVQEFYGEPFFVNEFTLIPRPDTEILTEEVIKRASSQTTCLELGTGSGCISISVARHVPCRIIATDISSGALDVARRNAQALKVTDRIEFREGSWFDPIAANEHFDLIYSNPPYIHKDDHHLDNLTYEPINALTDHADGLQAIKTIIDGAIHHLKPNGVLLFEHGYDQAHAVQQLLAAKGFVDIQTVKDYGDNDRVTLGTWLG